VGDRVAVAPARPQDLPEVKTSIEGDDPWIDIDYDPPWPTARTVCDDRADHVAEVRELKGDAPNRPSFPRKVAADWTVP
jgi:hypothetical protein